MKKYIDDFAEKIEDILLQHNLLEHKSEIVDRLFQVFFLNLFYQLSQDKNIINIVPLNGNNPPKDKIMQLVDSIPKDKQVRIVSDASKLTLEDFVKELS